MCFSAEASFTAAGALGATGVFFISRCWREKKIWLALIPCFFALQQASEGFLWVSFRDGVFPNSWSRAAEFMYLFFAYCFWPVWMPFALLQVEKVPWRRSLMRILLLMGSLFFLFGIFSIQSRIDEAKVVHYSISYGEANVTLQVLYAMVVVSPIILSTIPRMWIFGLLALVSFVISHLLFAYAFTSVWCFAAALICLGIYLVLKI